MRPLPRLFALTTDSICRAADFGVRAAAIAAAGPAAAILVRAPDSTTAQLAAFAGRVTALARPPEAAVFVHARPDLARAVGADGVQLRAADLLPPMARRMLRPGLDPAGRSIRGKRPAPRWPRERTTLSQAMCSTLPPIPDIPAGVSSGSPVSRPWGSR